MPTAYKGVNRKNAEGGKNAFLVASDTVQPRGLLSFLVPALPHPVTLSEAKDLPRWNSGLSKGRATLRCAQGDSPWKAAVIFLRKALSIGWTGDYSAASAARVIPHGIAGGETGGAVINA
jgi:hypothetical protein